MTRPCCPSCRLRFDPPTAATMPVCPACDGPLELRAPGDLLGFQLLSVGRAVLDAALAAALEPPPPRAR